MSTKRLSRTPLYWAALGAVGAFWACQDSTIPDPDCAELVSVRLDESAFDEIGVGAVTAFPLEGTFEDGRVEVVGGAAWMSDDAKIADVTAEGLVTARGDGNVNVRANKCGNQIVVPLRVVLGQTTLERLGCENARRQIQDERAAHDGCFPDVALPPSACPAETDAWEVAFGDLASCTFEKTSDCAAQNDALRAKEDVLVACMMSVLVDNVECGPSRSSLRDLCQRYAASSCSELHPLPACDWAGAK